MDNICTKNETGIQEEIEAKYKSLVKLQVNSNKNLIIWRRAIIA